MKNLNGKLAAVTGAGSGIGRGLATVLAEEGCHLAISDVNEDRLAETAKIIGDKVRVTTHIVDTAERNQVAQYARDAADQHGGVDIVINNAGVGNADPIEALPYEDFERLMKVNFWGVVYGTKEFLPYLKSLPEGHIVNLSSINGVLPFPGQS